MSVFDFLILPMFLFFGVRKCVFYMVIGEL